MGEGNGNPLQYSCLENPKDRGAWWAVIYGVTQSQTRLKLLSSICVCVCVCVCVCMHKKKLISRFHVPQSQCAGEGSRLVRNLELLMPTTDFPGGSLVRNLPAMQESWVQP